VNRRVLGQKFARLATNAVMRSPRLWALFRPLMRKQFDAIAGTWDTMRAADHLASYEVALEAIDPQPARALDLGTGTGQGAFAIARRFPDAEVVGVDLATAMLAEAERKTPDDLRSRVRFVEADASALPFPNDSFGLVAHANMIPFFDELVRVLEPGGQVLFAFSLGAGTPIYVPAERLRAELERRGFMDFAEFAAGEGTAFLAARQHRRKLGRTRSFAARYHRSDGLPSGTSQAAQLGGGLRKPRAPASAQLEASAWSANPGT
jgi:SAM-dependent methyltransferase